MYRKSINFLNKALKIKKKNVEIQEKEEIKVN